MTLTVNVNIENCPVTVEFEWTGRDEDSGPNWETMEVLALLSGPLEAKHWVLVNDLLSDAQWTKIEHAIYDNWKDLERQAYDNEY